MSLPRLLGVLLTGAALAPLAAVAIAILSASDHRWIDVFTHFAAPALSLAVAATVLLALLRAPIPVTGAGAIVTLLLLLAVWPQWRPAAGPKPAQPVAARLYFANLWAPNTDVPAIATSIADAGADIVVLVEVGATPAENLDLILADYPHRLVGRQHHGAAGVAHHVIAARRPIRTDPELSDGLAAISASIPTPAGELKVHAVHLTRPWPFMAQEAQLHQVRLLGERMGGTEGPAVVAGDFNSVSTGRVGRTLRAELGLTPEPAWTGTWPAKAPPPLRIAIDHVYATERVRVIRRAIGLPTGSDHRPVIVDLALVPESQIR